MNFASIINDSPAEELFEGFHFDSNIDALYERLTNVENKTPFVISVEGEWGTGKTTLLHHLYDKLNDSTQNATLSPNQRICRTVWFQAWKYNNEQEILSAFIQEIIESMRTDQKFERIVAKILKKAPYIKFMQPLAPLLKLVGIDIEFKLNESPHSARLGYYYHFSWLLRLLIKLYTERIHKRDFFSILFNPQKFLNTKSDDKPDKPILVIFIDDLDRCSQEKIITVLETIKLFLDFPGCVIILGVSSSVIFSAILEKTKESPLKYLEKIVQIRCPISKFHEEQLAKYVNELKKKPFLDKGILLKNIDIAQIIASFSETPRQAKMYLNHVLFIHDTLNKQGIWRDSADSEPSNEIKLLQEHSRFVYKLIMCADKQSIDIIIEYLKDPNIAFSHIPANYYLMKFTALCNNETRNDLLNIANTSNFDKMQIRERIAFNHFLSFYLLSEKINRSFYDGNFPRDIIKPLAYYLSDVDFWQNLNLSNIDERLVKNEEHRTIISFSRNRIKDLYSLVLLMPADEQNLLLLIHQGLKVFPGDRTSEANQRKTQVAKDDIELLITVKESYKDIADKYDIMIQINDQFKIDKYPVTNARFIKFLERLMQEKTEEEIKEYIFIGYSKFSVYNNKVIILEGYQNHPVTGVTWKGAIEFAKTDGGKYLPTCDQWRTAFGNNKFPYGNEFDKNKCNTSESNINDTTPVDKYPEGRSPLGIFDMLGNVWEWCLDETEEGINARIVGGSWADKSDSAAIKMNQSYPKKRGMVNIGFRCITQKS